MSSAGARGLGDASAAESSFRDLTGRERLQIYRAVCLTATGHDPECHRFGAGLQKSTAWACRRCGKILSFGAAYPPASVVHEELP